jgi:hypothetical protein
VSARIPQPGDRVRVKSGPAFVPVPGARQIQGRVLAVEPLMGQTRDDVLTVRVLVPSGGEWYFMLSDLAVTKRAPGAQKEEE